MNAKCSRVFVFAVALASADRRGSVWSFQLALVLAVSGMLTVPAWAMTVTGVVVGADEAPVAGGYILFDDGALISTEVDVGSDGRFAVPDLQGGKAYRIVYESSAGDKSEMRSWQLPTGLAAPITLQAAAGTLRDIIIRTTEQVATARSSFGIGVGTVAIGGSSFNGDDAGNESSVGWGAGAAYYLNVARFPLIGSGNHDCFWVFSLSYLENRYKVPQRVDVGSTSDVTYARGQVTAGALWSNRKINFEYGLGLIGSFGGMYDGGNSLTTPTADSFGINSFGLYGRLGYWLPVGKYRMGLDLGLNVMGSSSSHDEDFWSGSQTGMTVGLMFR